MTRWLLILGVFAITVVIPLFLLKGLLNDFENSALKFRNERLKDRGLVLMGKLEKALDHTEIFREEARRISRKFAFEKFEDTEIKIVQQSLVERFPNQTRYFYYSSSGELMKLFPINPSEGINVWKAFGVTLLKPDLATKKDLMRCDMLISSKISRLLSIESFKNILKEPIEILFQNKRHLIFTTSFRNAKNPSQKIGYLLALVPLFNSPRGWELRKASREMSQDEESVGGIWKSREISVGDDSLNPGFLNWFRENFRTGSDTYITGNGLSLGRFWSKDPDLLLVVNVRSNFAKINFLLITITKIALILYGLFVSIEFILLAFRFRKFSLSLARKFAIAVFLMIAFPLFALLIYGYQFFEMERRNLLVEVERKLEIGFERFQDEIARHLREFEKKCLALSEKPIFHQGTDVNGMHSILQTYEKSYGLFRYSFLHVRGTILEYGWEKKRERGSFEQLMSEIIKSFLKSNGYPIPPALAAKKTSFEIQKIAESKSFSAGRAPINLGKIRKIELGPNRMYAFQNFLYLSKGEKLAFLILFFNDEIFSRKAFRNACTKMQDMKIKSFYRAAEKISLKGGEISELLKRVEETNREIKGKIKHNGEEALVIARPLRNLGGTIALLLPVGEIGSELRLAIVVIISFFLFSMLAGFLAREILGKFFLTPLFDLAEGLKQIESGHFVEMANISPGDEIAEMANCYNLMIGSLRQKAKMSSFLKKGLIASVQAQRAHEISLKPVVVMFAGLRGFGDYEKKLSPEKAMIIINRFFSICEAVIKRFGGEIDKFIGDTAMILFFPNDEKEFGKTCENAVKASANMERDLLKWHKEAVESGFDIPTFGIGINAGTALAGSIGSEKKRLDFTVIGDPVNVAARLEKLAGKNGIPFVIAEEKVVEMAPKGFHWEEIPLKNVRGKSGEVKIFGLHGCEEFVLLEINKGQI
ncbi:MAG: adenylate/guanylate cyclase domain-containing protein [Candidatus Riflebacteria bacterium]|nr:adenylate/guanylate cyclase domain-containing protein [Candidatus Riflebacteria bacterium]